MSLPRRLPIYFLVDTSSAPAVKRSQRAIAVLSEDLRTDPRAIETACLSVITFSSEARQVMLLTEAEKFE